MTTQAPVVIADEPTKGLDDDRVEETVSRIRQLPDHGRAVLAITHDIRVARGLGGHIGVMRAGRMLEQGPVEEVMLAPRHPYTRAWLEADPDRWPRRTAQRIAAPVLHAKELTYAVGDRRLFQGLSLTLHRGNIMAITGPSGCGKTMLGNVLLGLARPHAGTVRWCDGTDPHRVRRPALRARFQKLHQDPASAFMPGRVLRRQLEDLKPVLPPDACHATCHPFSIGWRFVHRFSNGGRTRFPVENCNASQSLASSSLSLIVWWRTNRHHGSILLYSAR